jgi:hypothetical protein
MALQQDGYENAKQSHTTATVGACRSDHQPKPERLMEAMYQMDGVANRIQALLNKIRDGECSQPQSIDGIRNGVTMLYLLNEGPDYMNQMCEMMHNKLAEIEQELY